MKKKFSKLRLSKETVRDMAGRDLEKAAGGTVLNSVCACTTGCNTESFSQYQGSCPYTWRCCY
jgi:hypothetical protein